MWESFQFHVLLALLLELQLVDFSYVLTSGGEIDGVELAKSCLVGAISGALAPWINVTNKKDKTNSSVCSSN